MDVNAFTKNCSQKLETALHGVFTTATAPLWSKAPKLNDCWSRICVAWLRSGQHGTRANNQAPAHVTLQPTSRASQCTDLTRAATGWFPVPVTVARLLASCGKIPLVLGAKCCARFLGQSCWDQVHSGLTTPAAVLTDAFESAVRSPSFAVGNCLTMLLVQVLSQVRLLREPCCEGWPGDLLCRCYPGQSEREPTIPLPDKWARFLSHNQRTVPTLLWNHPPPSKPGTRTLSCGGQKRRGHIDCCSSVSVVLTNSW